MSKETPRELVLGLVKDHALDFAVYDRNGSEQLSRETLEALVMSGVVTCEEMAESFKQGLEEAFGLKPPT